MKYRLFEINVLALDASYLDKKKGMSETLQKDQTKLRLQTFFCFLILTEIYFIKFIAVTARNKISSVDYVFIIAASFCEN